MDITNRKNIGAAEEELRITGVRLRAEYISRINRVLDYIESHLGGSLNLADLAAVAFFSPYHFHRIFSAFMGETLYSYIRRKRLEKAAALLVDKPHAHITEIALTCGFSSSSAFSRAFGEHFHMSASQFRDTGYRKAGAKEAGSGASSSVEIGSKKRKAGSKMWKAESKKRKAPSPFSRYFDRRKPDQRRREMEVEVKDMPQMTVAYCRHVGAYSGVRQAFQKLFRLAGPRGLMQQPGVTVIAVYHDDPDITEQDKLQTSAGITVSPETEVEGEIGKMTLAGGRYAVGHFEVTPVQFSEAWDALVREWLPESGYQPDDRPCFEIYHNDPKDHPDGKFVVDICFPVKPMSLS